MTNSIVVAVALLARLAPGDEAVLGEEDRARGRVLVEQLRDPARHVEARPLVVEPDRLVAELLLGEPAPVRRRGERDHRVRMGVVDLRRRTNACSSVSIDGRGWSGRTALRTR